MRFLRFVFSLPPCRPAALRGGRGGADCGWRQAIWLFGLCFAHASWGQEQTRQSQEADSLAEATSVAPQESPFHGSELSLEALEGLETLPLEDVRRAYRRAARSAQDIEVRLKAIRLLFERDPSHATARICGRALRTDPEPRGRRAGAECLGRLPANVSDSEHTSVIAALADENLDVVTMAGWTLVRMGNREALSELNAFTSHPDPRVAALFRTYVERLQRQPLREPPQPSDAQRTLPEARPRGPRLDIALGAAWLATYGGLLGYAHGALIPLGHFNLADFSILSALTGGLAGVAVGGSLGAGQQLSFQRAHTIVQLGTLATVAGYSTGWLVNPGPARGLNASTYGLVGTVVGNGLALAFVHLVDPTAGGLAVGALSGAGVGFSTMLLANGYGFLSEDALAAGLWTGAMTGLVTTLVASPFDWGSFPILSATATGGVGALLGGLISDSPSQQAWSMVAGAGIGAAAGALLGLALPPELDPFREHIRLQAPALTMLPSLSDGNPQPLVSVAGVFSLQGQLRP